MSTARNKLGTWWMGSVAMLALSAGMAWAVGADEPPAREAAPPSEADVSATEDDAAEAPLGGPRVESGETKKTLVQRDFDGALKKIEGSPEEAAIDLLTLDEETTKKVDKVFAERAKAIDAFTMENLDLIQALAGAGQSGDRAETRKLLREALPKLGPIAKQGRLKTQIALVLPSQQAAEFTTLVDDYYAALASDQQRTLGKGGEKVSWLQATVRVQLQELGHEIRRSFYRQVGDGQEKLESLITKLGLSAEQESKVRKLVQDYAIENKFKTNGPKLGTLIASVMAELEPDQRRVLIQELLAARDGARGDAEGGEMRGEGQETDVEEGKEGGVGGGDGEKSGG